MIQVLSLEKVGVPANDVIEIAKRSIRDVMVPANRSIPLVFFLLKKQKTLAEGSG
jgi:hypothetical protein